MSELNHRGVVRSSGVHLWGRGQKRLRTPALRGKLFLSDRPSQMRTLKAKSCSFEGEVHMGKLPMSLTEVSFSNNNLKGTIQFEKMPPSIRCLFLANNHFSGSVGISLIPECLMFLNICANSFSKFKSIFRCSNLQKLFFREYFLGKPSERISARFQRR